MSPALDRRLGAIQTRVAGFSLAWLFLANLLGIWLAALLLWPRLGDPLGEFSYGRWMPLHMDWQLYGWCSLPALGLIAARYWKDVDRAGEWCTMALGVWSSALLVGGGSWLLGDAIGKPFLNWSGYARSYFALALVAVWILVARGLWRGYRNGRKLDFGAVGDIVFIVGLLAVPVALYLVSDAKVYPPVNPRSGGATGHSLLLSTLGIVALMGVIPSWGLSLDTRNRATSRRSRIAFGVLFVLSLLAYFSIEHGHASNEGWGQIFGLGSLMIWPVAVWWLWRGYAWNEVSLAWRNMFFFWWALLAVSGWIFFLPGILDTVKFTNAMVAHAHLAMAGMVSSLNMVILLDLGRSARVAFALGSRLLFWLWNGSLMVFLFAMMEQGLREGSRPDVLFLFDGSSRMAYLLRLLAGVVMLTSSALWSVRLFRYKHEG